MRTVTVDLGERSYPIIIRSGLLSDIGSDLVRRNIATRFALISDDNVAGLYGDVVVQSLESGGLEVELFTFPAGEASKRLQLIDELASKMARSSFDRSTAVIALGGGVSGDMAGFLSAIYMRGIPFVQIPTTLLAQVDSSVGGKTGVDLPEGKNLVGCFYQPEAVYIDPDVLKTLPAPEILAGLAEVIKYGVIRDKDFFDFLQKNKNAVLQLELETIVSLIARCCEIKAQVVAEDEREGGMRRILNFGHTIGHAVEAASDFSLLHGAAVAIGMRTASDLAVLTGHLAEQDRDSIINLLLDYGMKVDIPSGMDRSLIKKYLLTDKKREGAKLFFVLPQEIGKVIITASVSDEQIEQVLRLP